jgi:hypothetical protein
MTITIPDMSIQGLCKTAASFKWPFTASEFSDALYNSTVGYGSFVTGDLAKLVNRGLIEKKGKNGKRKTLYLITKAGIDEATFESEVAS